MEQNNRLALWDTHMHTLFSGDGSETPETMVETAKEKGLSGIIITDHLDWDYREEPHKFDLDLPRYFEEISALAKQEGEQGFPVGVGIELGLQPYLAERHKAMLLEYVFDFVIGSCHVVQGVDPYYPQYYQGKTMREAYQGYFECVLENITVFDDFDSLGHLDYVVRYGMRHNGKEAGACRYEDYVDIIDAILKQLIKMEKSLEVNTGAFRNDMDEPNPSYRILERYRELGGRLITIGADAHQKKHVALAFDTVVPRLQEIGFKEFAVYRKRVPEFYPL